jgi:predicted RNA-binding protein YlxR (DUF448 family)
LLAIVEPDETDQGLTAARKGAERLCLATRTIKPVAEMIRFVAGPDGTVVPDLERKLPGRGVWITATRQALDSAIRDKAIVRAFRGKASVPAELPELVERLLEKSALEGLSLANKAGQIVTGATRVEQTLGNEDVALVRQAVGQEVLQAEERGFGGQGLGHGKGPVDSRCKCNDIAGRSPTQGSCEALQGAPR